MEDLQWHLNREWWYVYSVISSICSGNNPRNGGGEAGMKSTEPRTVGKELAAMLRFESNGRRERPSGRERRTLLLTSKLDREVSPTISSGI
jgi:hypothetical protein